MTWMKTHSVSRDTAQTLETGDAITWGFSYSHMHNAPVFKPETLQQKYALRGIRTQHHTVTFAVLQ